MDAAHTWKCTNCSATGEGNLTDWCPICDCDIALTEAGYQKAIRLHDILLERAARIADLLDFGHEHISFDLSVNSQMEACFTTRWESANCGCGCSGYSQHEERIPRRYLWMDDDDILAERDAKEAAEKAEKARKQRERDIREAEAELARATRQAVTAQADAEASRRRAEAALAALRGAP